MGFENQKLGGKLTTTEKVLASVVAAGAGIAAAPIAVEKYNTSHYEYISEGVIDLGERLNEKFKTSLQVESQNGQYILHIGQIHGVNNGSSEWQQKVVAHQKELEELILELKQSYGVDVILEEGRYIDLDNGGEDMTLDKTLEVYKKFGHDHYLEYVLLPNLDKIDERLKGFESDDLQSIDELGLTSPQMKRKGYLEYYYTLENFESLLTHIISKENLSTEEVGECKEILERIGNIKQQATAMPGFTDLVYLVGGADSKLSREGVITTMPAETLGAIENPPKTRFQTFGAGADFHERREDVSALVAYQFALKNTDTKYIPIVYGKAHDFTDNVKAINELQNDDKYKIGLIRIDYKK
jgi:hypothetical protein